MGFLIFIILVGAVIGIICIIESKQEKQYLTHVASRDEEMLTQLRKKYSNIPENELRWIYSELDWVCNSLRDKIRTSDGQIYELIMSGNYNPLYPENKAREKLHRINSKYGWKGSDTIQFSTETSVSSVYENRYYLACIFSSNGNPSCSFHFRKY